MPNLNLDLDFFTHIKTVRLTGLLGKDTADLPIRLWCYTGKFHSADGRLALYSPQEVESAIGWRGKPGEMVEAMLKVGFLRPLLGGGYEVVGFMEHNGHLLAFRERAKQAAAKRWGATSNATSNAPTVPRDSDLLLLKSVENQKSTSKSKAVLEYLNKKASRHFDPDNKQLQTFVDARLKEGYSLELLKRIVDYKVYDWQERYRNTKTSEVLIPEGKTDMREYLCPETLFNATKCAKYAEQTFRADLEIRRRIENKKKYETSQMEADEIKKMVHAESQDEVIAIIAGLKKKYGPAWFKHYGESEAAK